MRLFHYTARHHLYGGEGHAGPGILSGKGILPNIHPYIDLLNGMVWLTDSPEWSQSWSTRAVPGVDCDRTQVRIEVTIPKVDRFRLKPWREVRWRVLTDQMRDDLEAFGDPEHWWIYAGRIPTGWVRAIEDRPAEAAA